MGLNKRTGNMYSFIDFTWNTIKGACYHNCKYCYMKRFKQKKIRFDDSELKTNLGKNNFIFVGSSNDLFSDSIPLEWIEETLGHCIIHKNKYLFQSKNPERMKYIFDFGLEYNSILCTTIETNKHYKDIMKNSPSPDKRVEMFANKDFDSVIKHITIEPIMDFDLNDLLDMIKACNPVQVNIGSDSGYNNLPEPGKDKVIALIEELNKFTHVYKKINLARLLR